MMACMLIIVCMACEKEEELFPGNLELTEIANNLKFAEGPAYSNGMLYFSDIEANLIYTWDNTNGLQVLKENSGGANGLYFDNSGNLIVCEGDNKRITLTNSNDQESILADTYNGKPFNQPNDVWVAPNGNIYFTDPIFNGTQTQDGEHVYCILASTNEILKVTDDLLKPNGIIGNHAGTEIYIADYGASQIYSYSIMPNGTFANKRVFAEIQADGLSIDAEENIYAAGKHVYIFNAASQLTGTIEVEGTITNVHVLDEEEKTIFITTHNSVFKKTLTE